MNKKNNKDFDIENITYRLNSEEKQIYSKWWSKIDNQSKFYHDFRMMVLNHLKSLEKQQNTQDVFANIYNIFVSALETSLFKSQFELVKVQLDALQFSIDSIIKIHLIQSKINGIADNENFIEIIKQINQHKSVLIEKYKLEKNIEK